MTDASPIAQILMALWNGIWVALMIKYRRWVAYSGFFHPGNRPRAVLLLGIVLSAMLMAFLIDGIVRLFTE